MTGDEIEAQAAFLQGKKYSYGHTDLYFDARCLNRPFDDQSQARTDDAFVSAARRLTPASSTRVVNPVVYALAVLQ